MKFNQIKFHHPKTKTCLGSLSIIRLIDGTMLSTHDYFGLGCPKNHENEEHLTSVYRSTDDGATWSNLTHIVAYAFYLSERRLSDWNITTIRLDCHSS